jgi:hypothetical protein
MAFTDPAEQRSILALSFEPLGDGYAYYHYRWSRGVPVTAEEREAYLNIPAMGSRRAWRTRIAGRETVPPRSYRSVQHTLLAAMPIRMAVVGIVAGSLGLLSGVAAKETALATIYMIGGTVMIVFGGSIVLARIFPRQDNAN